MSYKIGYGKPPPGFQPGQITNPKGRPHEPLTTILRDYLDANDGEHKKRIINALIKIAENPPAKTQIPAINMIYERLDGKVADKHEIKALIVNVDNEYAIELLKESRAELEEVKQQFLLGEGDAIKQG